jgi:hypothetical protein
MGSVEHWPQRDARSRKKIRDSFFADRFCASCAHSIWLLFREAAYLRRCSRKSGKKEKNQTPFFPPLPLFRPSDLLFADRFCVSCGHSVWLPCPAMLSHETKSIPFYVIPQKTILSLAFQKVTRQFLHEPSSQNDRSLPHPTRPLRQTPPGACAEPHVRV